MLIPILIGIVVLSLVFYTDANAVLVSPLKQLTSGIPLQDVKCKTDHVLVIKLPNGNPYCVRPTTAKRLLAQGWIAPNLETIQIINHNETNSIVKHENITPLISNQTINTNSGSGPSVINNGTTIEHMEIVKPYPPLSVNPIISSTKSGIIKILSIGMSPNQLRVGDRVFFTVTFQNISDKPIHIGDGCMFSPLFYTISPSSNAYQYGSGLGCPVESVVILPNQVYTARGLGDPMGGGYIIDMTGELSVSMKLSYSVQSEVNFETIQFNVTASADNRLYPPEDTPVYSTPHARTVKVSDLPPIGNESNLTIPPVVSAPPFPQITEPIIINYSNPNITKILAVGMSPNPLKLGDIPRFTVTYQNISGKPIYGTAGCGSDLYYEVLSSDKIEKIYRSFPLCAEYIGAIIKPDQTITEEAVSGYYYRIIQPGLLQVTLTLSLHENSVDYSHRVIDIIQFNVNATQW